jgi:hypothetical protein
MKPNYLSVAALCGGVFCGPAVASVQLWTLTGSVTAIAESAGDPLTGGGVTSWTLEVTVDTAAPDQEPGDPALGRYATTSVLTLGTLTQAFDSELLVYNDFGGVADVLQFVEAAPVPGGWSSWLVTASLQTTTSLSLLTSDAIPLPPPTAGDFETREWGAVANTTAPILSIQAVGEIGTLIPEPGSALLTGLLGMGLLTRRHKAGTR